jgi:GAF domain-containing protein
MDGGELSTSEENATAELAISFASILAELFSAGGVTEMLALVTQLAVSTIGGCDVAGIVLVDGDQLVSPAASGTLGRDIDDLHRLSGGGPCTEAVTSGLAVYSGDLMTETRWPVLAPLVVERGVRSILALPLPVDGCAGSINLYAYLPNAFGVIDRGRGQLLAMMTGLAVMSARAHEHEERKATNLHAALATRELIGQAQGILMEREHVDDRAAFDILRRASQHLNIKLRDVAQSLVDTGTRPETGGQ